MLFRSKSSWWLGCMGLPVAFDNEIHGKWRNIIFAFCRPVVIRQDFTHLDSNTTPSAVVMHEDTQHVWDKLRQVEFELSSQSHHNLLDQKDDGILHGVVWCPVLLQTKT